MIDFKVPTNKGSAGALNPSTPTSKTHLLE